MTKLNIGSGGQLREGWIHIDRAFTDDTILRSREIQTLRPLLQHELTDLPLPFEDGSVTQAVAHHSLCMFADADLRRLCRELYRLLEPGAMLRVSSVNFQHAIRALARGDIDWFARLGVPDHDGDPASTFLWYLNWGGARKTVFVSPEHLGFEFLEPAGFKWQQVGYHETTGSPDLCDFDSREDESWFVEARKP